MRYRLRPHIAYVPGEYPISFTPDGGERRTVTVNVDADGYFDITTDMTDSFRVALFAQADLVRR